jgi:glycosyltransferase involved in cell wall biosynthesis
VKILHVVPTYLPAVRYGGPIFAVHGLCRSLAAAGHQVHVFTTNVDGDSTSDVPVGSPVERDGVLVHYFASPFLRRLYYSPSLLSACRERVSTCDIAHLHSVFLYPTYAAARAASNASVPYILSPRGMLAGDLIERRSSLQKRAWIKAVERGNLRRAAAIHVTSAREREEVACLGLLLAAAAEIPNGVDEPVIWAAKEVSSDVRDICSRGYDILCFGRINWKKGLDRAIRAAASVPAARLLIAGNDDEGHAGELLRLAWETGAGDRVTILPRQILGADREALFAAARVVAMPSLSENFGNVVAEAQVRGKPVVVTDTVGAAEIVTAGGGGIVTIPDDAAFAAGLARILSLPPLGEKMGRAGAEYVRRHLSWAAVAARFETLYRGAGFRMRTPLAEPVVQHG